MDGKTLFVWCEGLAFMYHSLVPEESVQDERVSHNSVSGKSTDSEEVVDCSQSASH